MVPMPTNATDSGVPVMVPLAADLAEPGPTPELTLPPRFSPRGRLPRETGARGHRRQPNVCASADRGAVIRQQRGCGRAGARSNMSDVVQRRERLLPRPVWNLRRPTRL